LRPDEVYFTATHTHGGPGGWGRHPLERLVAGDYDADFFATLADRLAEAIQKSRSETSPSSMAFVQVIAPGHQKNRVDPKRPTHDQLSALLFRPASAPEGTPPTAILAVFGAHATVSHPVPPRLGGDYPSALVDALKQATGAKFALFAAGAVGDASPARPPAKTMLESARLLGQGLANDLLKALPQARYDDAVEVSSLRLEVDLPPVRLPFFTPALRLSPMLTWWIADRSTHLHALRIGPAALVGFPGDYSGHLADRLVEGVPGGLTPVATSFDGDFRGYFVSEPVHRDRPSYVTRWMSFYGPSVGDYLTDTARRMASRLAGVKTVSLPTRESTLITVGLRIAAVGLLAVAVALGFREVRRSGWGTRAFAAGGIVVAAGLAADPETWAWARVGLPEWIKLVGVTFGCVSLVTARKRSAPATAVRLALSAAAAVACWPAVLMWMRVALGRVPTSPEVQDATGFGGVR
jgi:hypothetical protein